MFNSRLQILGEEISLENTFFLFILTDFLTFDGNINSLIIALVCPMNILAGVKEWTGLFINAENIFLVEHTTLCHDGSNPEKYSMCHTKHNYIEYGYLYA